MKRKQENQIIYIFCYSFCNSVYLLQKRTKTYVNPLDKICKQFSSLYEVTYSPKALSGWHFSVSAAVDHGDYLGNSGGGMITIRKEGICIK